MKPAIEIQHLGKKYRIQKNEPYIALRDVLAGAVKNLFKKNVNHAEDFWALRDINISLMPGERVGIIGKNGAGKSTLLKILSRITPPTEGRAVVRGRLASLLEVGTGFHPELTGRENIYLNGSILGLKKSEIDKQYDAIVDFSGVEHFLHTPLKNYSSGMQLRLAFAVAAHLEPEILLIDEVLAVGDMEFQQKCIGKMEEVSREHGRTILFVSHNMHYISSLCQKAFLLEQGSIKESGPTASVINTYMWQHTDKQSFFSWKQGNEPGNDIIRLLGIKIIDEESASKTSFRINERVGIEMHYEVLQDDQVIWLGHNIFNQSGIHVFDIHSVGSPYYSKPHSKGIYTSVAWIPANLLNTGNYYVSSAAFNHLKNTIHFHEKESVLFQVYDVFDEMTSRGKSADEFAGIIRPLVNWSIQKQ